MNPGATEICDGIDNNCDDAVDEGDAAPLSLFVDADRDGYGDTSQPTTGCAATDGLASTAGDCEDGNVDVHPGAEEIPYNGVDEDCFEGDLVDVDVDGFEAQAAGGSDCDDADPAVHPGAVETWDDYGTDNDCDGDLFGILEWNAAEGTTRLDGVQAGGEFGRRLTYWDDGNCLFISAQNADSGRGVVYAEPGGTAGVRDAGDFGVVSTTTPVGQLSSDLAVSRSGRLLVSAATVDSGKGVVWLLDGDAACAGTDFVADDDATLTIRAESGTYFGTTARFLDDIDGDGVQELAIGAPVVDTGATGGGALYVWLTPPSDGASLSPADADVAMLGNQPSGYMMAVTEAWDHTSGPGVPYLLLTQAVATAGDVGVWRVDPSNLGSGGTVSDLADGGIATSSTGKAMTATVTSDTDFDGSDAVLAGAWALGLWEIRDLAGVVHEEDAALVVTDTAETYLTPGHIGLGDIDGDERGDYLLLAEDWPSGAERGKAAFFLASDLGSGGTWAFDDAPLHAVGAANDHSFGYRAVPAGDFDGDGRRDIAVSAYGTSHNGVASGSVYLIPNPFDER